MQGWIKFHREILDKPIWQNSTPEQKTILQTILLMANHQENEWEWKGERYKVQPGQFISSLEKIAERSGKGVSVQNVRTAIKRFEKYDFLTNESTNQNRLITVVNWGIYQGGDDTDNKEPNKQLTSDQQATNKRLTTNKNVKNGNNEKNDNKKDYTSKIKDLLSSGVFSQIDGFNELNKQYWDVIRETRKTKHVSQSVIYKNMEMWMKYDPIVIKYALKTHVDGYQGRKEEYTLGIMRNTNKDEAEDRLNRLSGPNVNVGSHQKQNENPYHDPQFDKLF